MELKKLRDLNAQVAVEVFGHTIQWHKEGEECASGGTWCEEGWHIPHEDPEYLKRDMMAAECPALRHCRSPESYSTDAEAAFEVLMEMHKQGFDFTFDSYGEDIPYQCCFKKKGAEFPDLFEEAADTLPMAICMAALSAKRFKPPAETPMTIKELE